MGGDPNQAARNVDRQDQLTEAVGTALNGQSEPVSADPPAEEDPPPPNEKPGPHAQGVAALLMAKEDEFKRTDLELQDREIAIDSAFDLAMSDAKTIYERAVKIADGAREKANAEIAAERLDLDRARDGIDAAMKALT